VARETATEEREINKEKTSSTARIVAALNLTEPTTAGTGCSCMCCN